MVERKIVLDFFNFLVRTAVSILGLLAFMSLVLSSCNLTRLYIKRSEKVYSLLGMTERYIETDSANIYIRKVGAGPSLVLIHGFGPLPQVQWQDIAEGLSGDYELIIPDLVYFGKSNSSHKNFDIKFQARQIYQAIGQMGVEQFSLAGLSYGGMVATLIAHEHPEEVDKLILLDALSVYSERSYSDSIAQNFGVKSMANLLLPDNGKQMKKLFEITYYNPPGYPAFLLNGPAKKLYQDPQNRKEGMMRYLYEHEETLKTWTLDYPGEVLVVWGKYDQIIPVKNAYLLNEQYQGDLKIIDKSGHIPNMERPEEVNEAIKAFLLK